MTQTLTRADLRLIAVALSSAIEDARDAESSPDSTHVARHAAVQLRAALHDLDDKVANMLRAQSC